MGWDANEDPFLDGEARAAEAYIQRGISVLRVLQLLTAALAGGVVAIFKFSDTDSGNDTIFDIRFYDVSEMQYFCVVALLVVLYDLLVFNQACARVFGCCSGAASSRAELARTATIWQTMRVAVDFLLMFLTFSAGAAAANVCTRPCERLLKAAGFPACDPRGESRNLCEDNPQGPIGVFFMFFCFMLTAMAGYFEYNRLRQRHIRESQEAVREMIDAGSRSRGGSGAEADEEERQHRSRPSVVDPDEVIRAEEEESAERVKRSATEGGHDRARRFGTNHNLALMEEATAKYFEGAGAWYHAASLLVRAGSVALGAAAVYLFGREEVRYDIPASASAAAPSFSYYEFTEFQFAVAVGVLVAAYSAAVLVLKAVKAVRAPDKRDLDSTEHWQRALYFVFDLVFALLTLSAGLAVLGRCTRSFDVTENDPLAPSLQRQYCEDTPGYAAAGLLFLVLFFGLLAHTFMSWSRWLNQRAGEHRTKRERMRRQKVAMDLLATPDGPLAVSTHQEFNALVKVLTMSNIHGLHEEHFETFVDFKYAVRMARTRVVQGVAGALVIAALVVQPDISGAQNNPASGAREEFSFKYFELTEFQYVFGVAALLVAYVAAWLLGRAYTARFQRGDAEPHLGPEHTLAPLDVLAQLAMAVLTLAAAVATWFRCSEVELDGGYTLCEDTGESRGPRAAFVFMCIAAIASVLALRVSFKRWLKFRASEEVGITREAAIAIQAKLGYRMTYDTAEDFEAEEEEDEGGGDDGRAYDVEMAARRG